MRERGAVKDVVNQLLIENLMSKETRGILKLSKYVLQGTRNKYVFFAKQDPGRARQNR